MSNYMKYLPGLHMFVAGWMFVFMFQDIIEGNLGMAFISAILFLANLCAYIHDVRGKDESVH